MAVGATLAMRRTRSRVPRPPPLPHPPQPPSPALLPQAPRPRRARWGPLPGGWATLHSPRASAPGCSRPSACCRWVGSKGAACRGEGDPWHNLMGCFLRMQGPGSSTQHSAASCFGATGSHNSLHREHRGYGRMHVVQCVSSARPAKFIASISSIVTISCWNVYLGPPPPTHTYTTTTTHPHPPLHPCRSRGSWWAPIHATWTWLRPRRRPAATGWCCGCSCLWTWGSRWPAASWRCAAPAAGPRPSGGEEGLWEKERKKRGIAWQPASCYVVLCRDISLRGPFPHQGACICPRTNAALSPLHARPAQALRPLGVKLMKAVVKRFGEVADPMAEGQLLLELYQAQVVSAIRCVHSAPSTACTAGRGPWTWKFMPAGVPGELQSFWSCWQLSGGWIAGRMHVWRAGRATSRSQGAWQQGGRRAAPGLALPLRERTTLVPPAPSGMPPNPCSLPPCSLPRRASLSAGASPTLQAAGASLAATFLEKGLAGGDATVMDRLMALLSAPLAQWVAAQPPEQLYAEWVDVRAKVRRGVAVVWEGAGGGFMAGLQVGQTEGVMWIEARVM